MKPVSRTSRGQFHPLDGKGDSAGMATTAEAMDLGQLPCVLQVSILSLGSSQEREGQSLPGSAGARL